ncbi:MAG: ornithine carbamoyltransferase [Pseudomonadota bacterium]
MTSLVQGLMQRVNQLHPIKELARVKSFVSEELGQLGGMEQIASSFFQRVQGFSFNHIAQRFVSENSQPKVPTLKTKDVMSILDTEGATEEIIDFAIYLKEAYKQGKDISYLKGKRLAMIFERQALRTRVSFEMGMQMLGGHAVFLDKNDIGIGKRESPRDVGSVLSRYVDIIMHRSMKTEDLHELAFHSTVPVINGLDVDEHPCQILADLMTIKEKKGTLKGLNFVFIGDCDDNVPHSYMLGCLLMGMNVTVVSPKDFAPSENFLKKAMSVATRNNVKLNVTDDMNAVRGADVVATDTWVTIWYEHEREQRIQKFQNYTVTPNVMKMAKDDAIFMHCMPIYYGNEVQKEVAYGKQSVIIDEAENRMWAQMALMVGLLKSQ